MSHSLLALNRIQVQVQSDPQILDFTINTSLDTSKPATFTLNLLSGKTREAETIIDWGDGTTTIISKETTTADKTAELKALCTHVYSTPGVYNVIATCSALFPRFDFNGSKQLVNINSILPQMDVENFTSCFQSCTWLTTIPQGLFDKNTLVTSFNNCFRGSGLTIISQGLFDNNTLVTNFSNCFNSCTWLTTIPQGLFDKNTLVTSFNFCFNSCTWLTTIPQGLFDNNTLVTNFSNCFQNCSRLTTIPQGLFDKNTLVTSFSSCFYGCAGLTTIPQGLFDNNIKVTHFEGCFNNCSGLTTIPQGLFDKNTLVTSFSYCFNGCAGLTTIPQGLFDNNIKVNSFGSCFQNCSRLTTIPQGLFDNNTLVTNFMKCFYSCNKLQLNSTIFSLTQDKVNRFAGKSINFSDCFTITPFTGIQGTAPDLWNYTYKSVTSTTAFKGHTTASLTNFADIPTAWK